MLRKDLLEKKYVEQDWTHYQRKQHFQNYFASFLKKNLIKANSLLLETTPFQYGIGVQESKQKITKVVFQVYIQTHW